LHLVELSGLFVSNVSKTLAKQSEADFEWDGAIAKWQAITEEAGVTRSGLARSIRDIEANPKGKLAFVRSCKEQIRDLMDNTFAQKATRTLLGRAGHVSMCVRWCESKLIPPFELSVNKFLAFGDHARREKAPATQVASVKKALRVASALLDLDTPTGLLNHEACKGVVTRGYQRKRLTKWAVPRSVKAIKALETAVVHDVDLQERVIAGAICFGVRARMRGADLLRVCEELTLDLNAESGMGYIDLRAHVTKTSRGRFETGRHGVDSTAPSWDLAEDHWAQHWMLARQEANPDASAQGFLMPSVGPDGFVDQAMHTDEPAIHVREMLVKGGGRP